LLIAAGLSEAGSTVMIDADSEVALAAVLAAGVLLRCHGRKVNTEQADADQYSDARKSNTNPPMPYLGCEQHGCKVIDPNGSSMHHCVRSVLT